MAGGGALFDVVDGVPLGGWENLNSTKRPINHHQTDQATKSTTIRRTKRHFACSRIIGGVLPRSSVGGPLMAAVV